MAAAYNWHTTFHGFGIIGIVYALVLMLFLHENKEHTEMEKIARSANEERDIALQRALSAAGQYRLLGYPVLFCCSQSARLGYEELVTYALCRKSGHSHVRSRTYLHHEPSPSLRLSESLWAGCCPTAGYKRIFVGACIRGLLDWA